ncbi:MAG: helix-hairpin-helix domain-containing protein [Clostridiales bacterium]|nr:helix-hairpin-helix domain-containing protein [Clostridiales bacterium]
MPRPHKTHIIILAVVAVLCFGIGAQFGRITQETQQADAALLIPLPESEPPTAPLAASPVVLEEQEPPPPPLAVHVKGAVERPGLYTLPQGSRVDDALKAAGLKEDANVDIINLAAHLADGMEVIVIFRAEGEETDWQALVEKSAVITDSGAEVNTAETAAATSKASINTIININTASLSALQTLSGIGPVKAQSIITYREQHGPFQKIDDIKKVSGIGQATYDNIKDRIVVE